MKVLTVRKHGLSTIAQMHDESMHPRIYRNVSRASESRIEKIANWSKYNVKIAIGVSGIEFFIATK